jgi:AhpD family alkylhydroperoxidase
MQNFRKRRYVRPGDFVRDLVAVARQPVRFAQLCVGAGGLDGALREKLMLVVTSINRCRYCTVLHRGLALRQGLSPLEVDRLLRGLVDQVTPDEQEALLFAIHWAETKGEASDAWRQRIRDVYGDATAQQIEYAIEAIMLGNYVGNTVDYLWWRMQALHSTA